MSTFSETPPSPQGDVVGESRAGENRDLVILKLGGSLITDKRSELAARRDVIERLAGEIAEVRGEIRAQIVLGHGSGSFGHVAAARYELGKGLRREDGTSPLIGVSVTQDHAARLHRLVIDALVRAGVETWSVVPSNTLLANNGRLTRCFLDPLLAVLGEGLMPVVYGDVVTDLTLGASICSTEKALDYLVRRLLRRGYRARRLFWLGETAGILDLQGHTIPDVSLENYREVLGVIKEPDGTDVTGGMLLRLETARSLARIGIESLIFDGRQPGALAVALRGEDVDGTRISP